ncbi:MAG: metal-dependent hydrolase [Acidobacteria bacterium]|nr:metal-dependent hydrolase [Acidobacteriota bacterium]
MDNLCHTLVGAALGEAGLKHRTRFGGVTLMLAANLPDIDVLVFATSTPSVAFRRGWTHGVLAQAVLPLALAAAMMAVARLRPARGGTPVRVRGLLLLSYLGVLSHVALDLLNSYGVRLLAPFDWRWFYGDALFIIDPWLWLLLGAGLWMSRRSGSPVPPRHALAAVTAYIMAMVVNAHLAGNMVLERWRVERGGPPAGLMVGPLPITPFEREIIVDAGIHYERGTVGWLPRHVTLDPAVVPKSGADPRVVQASDAPNIRAFLVWSRFPFWTFEPVPGGTRVTVGDMRFAGRGSPFVQSTIVPGSAPPRGDSR